MYDIIIVGGGPAGLTAGIYAARAGKKSLIYESESVGGQIVFSPMVENYPALPHVSGSELANRIYEQADALGVEIESDNVVSVNRKGEYFSVKTELGENACRAVILATGVQHKRLGLAGEDDLVGCGVSYCAVCDGAFYAGREVAVIGGGDTALQDALFLANICKKVYLVVRRNVFRGEAALVKKAEKAENIEILFRTTAEELVAEGGELTALKLLNGESTMLLPVSAVFVAIGQQPCGESFAALAETDSDGYFITDESLSAGEGIFAAGDCRRKTVRQLSTAVGDGAAAAVAACSYLDRA